MKNLELHFKILDLKEKFYEFLTENNLHIFVIFAYFAKI